MRERRHLILHRYVLCAISTPSDGATAWIAPNWPIPAVTASRRTAARVTPGPPPPELLHHADGPKHNMASRGRTDVEGIAGRIQRSDLNIFCVVVSNQFPS